ncbi:hypothetical protein SAMN03159423_4877 [Bradyrhizobium sp. NFR13]|nr:hypothetical protein SAMN03159423_4877 [Bradyrhizobium sp. NFR13]
MLTAVKSGCVVIVNGPKDGRLFVFGNETEASALYEGVKKINADFHALGLDFNLDTFRDGALGLSQDLLLQLI